MERGAQAHETASDDHDRHGGESNPNHSGASRAVKPHGRPGSIGSDAPFAVGSLARSIASIREFEFLPKRDRERILGANAKAFLDGSA